MKIAKPTTAKKQAPKEEKQIQKGLRTSGYIFPETVEEVMELEKSFSSTEITLPEDLQEPAFLFTIKIETGKESKKEKQTLAMAARNEGNQISAKTRKAMDKDREKAAAKLKKKKNA